MGTNYYRVRIPSEREIYRMHQMIDDRMFESKRGCWDLDTGKEIKGVTCVQDLIEDCTSRIHICKMSFGWKTCFDHNWGKYYRPSRKSLDKFLRAPYTYIEDEYGEVIDVDEFWKLVDERDHTPRSNGRPPLTSKLYNDEHEENGESREYPCREDIKKCKEMFKVNPEDNDFEVDGLRFAVFSDFS